MSVSGGFYSWQINGQESLSWVVNRAGRQFVGILAACILLLRLSASAGRDAPGTTSENTITVLENELRPIAEAALTDPGVAAVSDLFPEEAMPPGDLAQPGVTYNWYYVTTIRRNSSFTCMSCQHPIYAVVLGSGSVEGQHGDGKIGQRVRTRLWYREDFLIRIQHATLSEGRRGRVESRPPTGCGCPSWSSSCFTDSRYQETGSCNQSLIGHDLVLDIAVSLSGDGWAVIANLAPSKTYAFDPDGDETEFTLVYDEVDSDSTLLARSVFARIGTPPLFPSTAAPSLLSRSSLRLSESRPSSSPNQPSSRRGPLPAEPSSSVAAPISPGVKRSPSTPWSSTVIAIISVTSTCILFALLMGVLVLLQRVAVDRTQSGIRRRRINRSSCGAHSNNNDQDRSPGPPGTRYAEDVENGLPGGELPMLHSDQAARVDRTARIDQLPHAKDLTPATHMPLTSTGKVPTANGVATARGNTASSRSTTPSRRADLFMVRSLTLHDLEEITYHFKHKIGEGGSSVVYKGKLEDGTEVAVKALKAAYYRCRKDFTNEVKLFGNINHRYLVRLLGYCYHDNGHFLVYDHVGNKSLHDHLHKASVNGVKTELDWPKRVKIANQVAFALEYLHHSLERPVVHRDVKPKNVFLTSDLTVKLGDFGLCRPIGKSGLVSETDVVGTLGYMAPEVLHSELVTEGADVYAYGIVLLELITGKIPDAKLQIREWVKKQWRPRDLTSAVRLVDPRLGGAVDEYELCVLLLLGLHCCRRERDQRPIMRDVTRKFDELKRSRGSRDSTDVSLHHNHHYLHHQQQ
ncbi:hypothetical protein CBR_g48319 [Chara braunii]|uniref:Protein kinase domain-containing protein n=1 Tax=Chara braunii TaxID=69332 RepID=A0A388K482_CHABU|nr:hypothetical protein CBR_g48319 [Chara braunii]|eukprot:GBG64851.1 hypothetical protein CBR_g48319 [Chara braunii]